MKKLFALLMALTMTFQLVTPAWADAVQDELEEPLATVEEVEETEEPTEEVEEVPEETEAETEETEAETTEAAEETTAEEAATKVRVRFACTPEDLTLVVYPADGDVDQAIEAEADGSYLLTSGEYGYLAGAEGYVSAEGRFTVTDEESQVEVALAQADAAEEVEALDEGVVASGECGTGLTWVLDEDGVLTISGEGEIWDYDYGSLNGVLNRPAPWEAYKNQIKAARIEPGVTSIGIRVFYGCSSLTSVTIPDSVASIGDGAFSGCSGLTSVTIPEGVMSIGDYTFYNCSSLTSVIIPKGVTSIGNYTFSCCIGLTSVSIPESVTSIGEDAFVGCSGLTSVSIPEGVTSLSRTFYGCSGLTSVSIPESVTGIGDCTFYKCSSLTSVTIPDSVTSIGDYSFSGCIGLTSVSIPESVTSIGKGVFLGCSGLTSVTIPQSVASIGDYSLSGCSGLMSVAIPESVASIGDYSLSGCSGLMSVAIPESVTSIGEYAFYECSKLKHVYYGGSDLQWKEIQIGTFNWPLTDATIHYGSTHIHNTEHVLGKAATCTQDGTNAYYVCSDCSKFFQDADGTVETTAEAEIIPALGHDMTKTEAAEPTHTTTGNNAYYTCSRCGKVYKDEQGKTETTIEAETLEKLPGVASGKCGENLTWVVYEDGRLVISGYGDMDEYGEVYAPGHYRNVGGPWRDYKPTSLSLPDGITHIGGFAFYDCTNLTGSLVIPDSVTSIGDAAFGNTGFTGTLKLPEGLTAIAPWTFENCSKLSGKLVIPDGVTSIGGRAFSGCKGLFGQLNLPDTVESINYEAFAGCVGFFGKLTLPEHLNSLGFDAFEYCSGFTGELVLPDSLTELEGAFRYCSGITGVVFPKGITKIPAYLFENCSQLTSGQNGILVIPDGVVEIGNNAFSWCSAKEVVLPASLKRIGASAFQYCTIGKCTLPDGLEKIEESAFACTGMREQTDLIIPDSVTYIGNHAFQECHITGKIVLPKGIDYLEEETFYGCQEASEIWIPANVVQIRKGAFRAVHASDIYYFGSLEEWNNINIREDNGVLTTATLHYGLTHICDTHLVPAVAPTCTEKGNNAYYICDICNQVYKDEFAREQTTVEQETLPALGHTMTKVEEKVATCTEGGNVAYFTCSTCGKHYTDDVGSQETTLEEVTLAPLGHTMTKTEAKAPTDTENGNNAYYTCETCHKVFKDKAGQTETTVEEETLPTLEKHELVKVEAKDPTCTETGNRVYYTCNLCDKLYRDETAKFQTTLEAVTIAPLGHTMEKTEAVEPTYRTTGNNVYYTCTRCGKVYKDEAGQTETTVEDEVLAVLPSIALGDCGQYLTWVLTEDGTLIVSGNGDIPYFGSMSTAPWYQYRTNIRKAVLEDGVTNIGSYAFYSCYQLTEISIPEGVKSIGDHAFYNCAKLEKAELPDSVTYIGSNAFYNCGSLREMRIPDGVTTVDNYTFYRCTNLKSVVLPDSVTSISSYAFYDCSNLTELVLPAKLGEIGERAFYNCESLTKLDIPETVTSIGYEAFSGCSGLTGITIPDGVAQIGSDAFSGCSSLTSIYIPKGLARINSSTFSLCSSLTDVVIPDGVLSIDNYAFSSCSGLTSVSIPDSVTSIGYGAFSGCSNLKDVYYSGDEVAWKQIEIDSLNDPLTSAYLHYGLTHICTTHLIPALAPTCTTAGNNAYYLCDACGRVYKDEQNREQTTVEEETLPALGHAMTLTEAKAATCTEDGNNAYYTCGNCHKVFLDEQGEKETTAQAEILPALGHSISIVNTVAPTCTEKGNRLYYTCATCGKAFKDKAGLEATTPAAETIPALGHTMVKTDAVSPTCTEKGSNAYYTCETCEKVFKDAAGKLETTVEAEVLEALGHSMVLTEAKDATCTETGNKAYYTCKTCGKVYQDLQGTEETTVKAETIPALGHTMTKTEAVAPTCTEPGNNAYYTCSTCHKVYKDEAGTQETTAQAEVLKALGHDMTRTEPKAPTCTTAGTNGYYTCGTCHKVFKDQQGNQETTVEAEVLAALGHSMVKTEAKAPTCTESGNNAYYTCGTCHNVYKDEAGKQGTTVSAEQLAAFGHSMVRTAAKEATCTTDGNNTYYTCRTCGKVYKDLQGAEETTVKAETVAALGHTMERTNAVAPTCTESGNNTYYTCGTCQKVFKDQQGKQETTVKAETLAALGHSMVKTEAEDPTCTESGNNAYYTCKTCRKVFKDAAGQEETTVQEETLEALGHTMTKTEAVAPSCTEKGNNAYYTCGTCHKVFKDEAGQRLTTVSAETLAAFGHSMVKTAAKEATCAEAGNNLYYTCKTCGKVYQDEAGEKPTTVTAETLPTLGHTMTKTEAIAPTCTEPGSNAYYTCETCHKVYKDEAGKLETTAQGEFLPALGHDMDKTEAVAPTHTSGGSNAYYTCRTCHKVFADAQGTMETTPEQEQLPRLPGIADGKSGSLTWIISDEGTLTVSGKGRMPDYSGSALAPWYDYREKIAALEVEEGVQSIGDYAFFDCENLTTIQLPQSLTKLGKSCFVGCDSLALLDLTQVPGELTQKVTDLTGLAALPETLSKLAGAKASYQWSLETVDGQPAAKNLAKLAGSQLTVLRSGAFRLVCLEEYTGLTAYVEAAAQTTTVIRPEEQEQLTGGEKLELSAWAMPFETELTADWTLTEESKAYATVTKDGVLTAKSVTKPVQITVKAAPKNGEDPAEKTLWLLPKTIGMGILVNGHLVGESLTAELDETELELTAQIQPQGAKTEVTWTSSREDVAEIDAAGTVKLLKPGTTLIRAQSTDGSGVAAELTLKVQYLDGAEKLTLTADADAAGLELGRTAQLTLSGENAIDPEYVEFQITQGSAAAVDEKGLLTAGNVPGKVTVVAALKDDPLQRRAQLTVEIVPVLIRALKLEPQVSQEWGYAEEASGESWVYGEVEAVAGKNRTFQINAQGKDYREAWTEVTNLTFESSDPAVARVDAKGLVTLTAKEAGECVITVRCTDTLGTETKLHIVLRDSAPRLENTKLTLNSYLNAGVTTSLVESCGNTIQSVTLYDYNKSTKGYTHSTAFDAEAEDGTLTVRALGAQKNSTYQLKLVVDCLGGSYDYILQVKVVGSLPKVTVKQIGKFDTFYLDSTAQLTATAAGCQVERLELVGADSFRMDEDGNLFYAESYNPGDKPVTNGKLLVYLEGYQVPVEKNVTIATTKTAPKLTLNPTASIINTAVEEPACRVKVLWNGKALDLTDADVTQDVGFVTVEAQGQYLTFRLTGGTGGTAKLSLRLPGWAQAVSLTHKITVDTKLPTVKLGATTLKLNSLFTAQTAETAVWLTQGNLSIDTMGFVSAKPEGKNITLSFDPETDTIQAKFNGIPPKAGTYSYTYTAYLEDGTALKNGTIKVTVAATAPKVKLSASSVKLNRYLAGQEKAVVKVTLTGGTGYQVTDFEGMPEYMSYDAGTGNLTVVLPDETFTGETCTLHPIVRDEESGQEVPLSTKLTLKVQTINTNKLTVSLSAKGKLDTVNPDSAVAYTVTKVSNCLGLVDGVSLEGNDGAIFQAELDTSGAKPVVLLRLLPGESYATNKTYKVQFCFTVCGQEVHSSVLSVKVSQTALKVTGPKTAVYYLAQSGPMRCSLTANLPLESVSLSAKTAKEFQQALGGEENLRLVGNRLEFRLANPSALKAGKSYSVQLELLPENAAENTKPTIVKLTVKVMK